MPLRWIPGTAATLAVLAAFGADAGVGPAAGASPRLKWEKKNMIVFVEESPASLLNSGATRYAPSRLSKPCRLSSTTSCWIWGAAMDGLAAGYGLGRAASASSPVLMTSTVMGKRPPGATDVGVPEMYTARPEVPPGRVTR